MARALRIQYPGAFYHITSRGNERQEVFKSERDREKFLSYICHRFSGRKLNEIGAGFNTGESAVSQTSRRFASMLGQNGWVEEIIGKLNRELGLSDV